MDARIVELEVRLAFQERVIGDLDEVIRHFANRVETLERQLQELKRTVVEAAGDPGPANERPPHY